ncbi:hypothetical protein BKA82DRAFT_1008617 [Pisolithus tinctorius]|uniref:Uncharacterized protein n=1 Tax=Pisolithus tinctorius Marx 270 TaxID=870435 RepID=A0A0C3NEQ9_PISTI|nr:hypothetical protein BKA82DRAFT_1008617 [Pisolithus tinctorius]KIN93998.1 hypothetical protein M404DRAFT_1008617 [Pisolithus tinctorius Marx 270]
MVARVPTPTVDTQQSNADVDIAAPIETVRPPSMYVDGLAPPITQDTLPNSASTPTPVLSHDQTTSSHSLTRSAGEISRELSSSQLSYRLEDPAEDNQPDILPGIVDIRPHSPSGCSIVNSSTSEGTQGGCTHTYLFTSRLSTEVLY